MLKRPITYTDFNGVQKTGTYYFNLSKNELIEMEFSRAGGLGEALQRIIEGNDNQKLVKEFKELILSSYGERSEDGDSFIKSEELRAKFAQTAAYDALYMELLTSATVAAEFLNGIIPVDLQDDVSAVMKGAQTVQLPPPPPATA